jgi:probable addiction module antidote protein
MAMATETIPFDAAPYFPDTESQQRLLTEALATGNAGYIAAAIGTVAKARGMSKIARDAGVSRGSLYKALSPEGDPQLSTLLEVLKALGLELAIRGAA